jgi:hypothetical protein
LASPIGETRFIAELSIVCFQVMPLWAGSAVEQVRKVVESVKLP